MDIRFYDFEFNLLWIEHKIISTDWYIKYNGIGTFEGHFELNGNKVRTAFENDYIVAVQGDFQAVITAKQICGNELILYGRTVNWLLSKRVTPNFSTYRLEIGINAEDIARWAVENAFADVENFVIADKVGLDCDKHFWRNVYNPTSEVVADCLDNACAGHELKFDRDTKTWVFRIYKGTELPLIISVENKNVYAMEYSEDIQNYCSQGWYEKIVSGDDGEESVWQKLDSGSEKSGIYRWEGVLSGGSESEALSALKGKKRKKDCEAACSDLRYGADYALGDVVRVQFEFGEYKVSEKKRIVGVKVWSENNNCGEMPVFADV